MAPRATAGRLIAVVVLWVTATPCAASIPEGTVNSRSGGSSTARNSIDEAASFVRTTTTTTSPEDNSDSITEFATTTTKSATTTSEQGSSEKATTTRTTFSKLDDNNSVSSARLSTTSSHPDDHQDSAAKGSDESWAEDILSELAERAGDALASAVVAEEKFILRSTSTATTSSTNTSPTDSSDDIGQLENGDAAAQGLPDSHVPTSTAILHEARRDEDSNLEQESRDVSPKKSEGGDAAAAKPEEHVCGQGEYRKTCADGEVCCNQGCGTCAPKGKSCLQIACGELKRGGGGSAKVQTTRIFLYRSTQYKYEGGSVVHINNVHE